MDPLSAGILTLALSAFAAAIMVTLDLLLRRFLRKKKPEKTYSQRLSELTNSLVKASKEVDEILAEITEVAQEREETMRKLETAVGTMEQREQQIKQRIERLEKVEPAVAKDFAELVRPMQKRSAYRDYILFGAGIAVTTVIAILIQVIAG